MAPAVSATTEVEYLAGAVAATPMERERLWREAVTADRGDEQSLLRLALLRSLSGHSGHAPGTAHRDLSALRASSSTPGIAAIASIRLAQMRAAAECEQHVEVLEQRLSRIADIERELEVDESPDGNHE